MSKAKTIFIWEGTQLLKQRRENLLWEEIFKDFVPYVNGFLKNSIYVKCIYI